jgi:hypothetical protein
VDEPGSLHRIEDDLAENSFETWIAQGLGTLEDYLSKHLAFLAYLEPDDRSKRG